MTGSVCSDVRIASESSNYCVFITIATSSSISVFHLGSSDYSVPLLQTSSIAIKLSSPTTNIQQQTKRVLTTNNRKGGNLFFEILEQLKVGQWKKLKWEEKKRKCQLKQNNVTTEKITVLCNRIHFTTPPFPRLVRCHTHTLLHPMTWIELTNCMCVSRYEAFQ